LYRLFYFPSDHSGTRVSFGVNAADICFAFAPAFWYCPRQVMGAAGSTQPTWRSFKLREVSMAFCANCGTQLADNAAFCPVCGKAAGQAAGATAVAAQPAPQAPPPTTAAPVASAAPLADNVAGMLAYFTIIPAIVFLLIEPYNRNRFVRFHSFQCLFTCAALIVIHVGLSIVSYMVPLLALGVWGLLGLAELALWILLVIKAYQGQMFKLPVVGDMAEKQAGA
jgi:uncharacterized membrane protein